MRRWIFFILLFCASEKVHSKKLLSVSQQKKDFQILVHALFDDTGNPYIYKDSLAFREQVEAIQKQLVEPSTATVFFRKITPLVSSIGCGHTSIMPSKSVLREFLSKKTCLPFDVRLIGEKLYALKAFGKKNRIAKEDEIIEINGLKMPLILEEMYKYISSDGFNVTLKQKIFREYFLLYYFIAFDGQDEYVVKFISNNVINEMKVAAAYPSGDYFSTRGKEGIFREHEKNDFGTLKIDKKNNVSIFTFSTFKDSYGKRYSKFLEEKFARIKRSKTQYLIIDLRGNGGGRIQTELIGYFTNKSETLERIICKSGKKPFCWKYVRKFNQDFRIYNKHRKRAKRSDSGTYSRAVKSGYKSIYQFNGKRVVVLVDGSTFSAASTLATNLKRYCNATIIGEKTGGAYDKFNTGLLKLKLPESNIPIVINPIEINLENNISSDFKGLPPDIEIQEPFKYKKKDDPYLKAALDYICLID